MSRAAVPATMVIKWVSNFLSPHHNRDANSQILVKNRIRVLGSEPHTSTQLFGENPPAPPAQAPQEVFVLSQITL